MTSVQRPDAAILLYAARYAIGRRSGAAQDVRNAIAANKDVLRRDAGCREALLRDIAYARNHGDLGAPCDVDAWNDVEEILRGA